jgi:hypothetical protein
MNINEFRKKSFSLFGGDVIPLSVVPEGKSGYGYEDALWISGRERSTLLYSEVDRHYDILPFLSHEAYRYYIPVYMCFGLEKGDRVLEFTTYSFSSGENSSDDVRDFMKARKSFFSQNEMELIRSFLKVIGEEKDRDLECALDYAKFWLPN